MSIQRANEKFRALLYVYFKMADDICQFNELLQKFLSVDNEQRCQAEVNK